MRTSGGKNRQSDCCKWQQSLKIRVETPCEGIEQEARGFDHKDLGTRIKRMEDCSLISPNFSSRVSSGSSLTTKYLIKTVLTFSSIVVFSESRENPHCAATLATGTRE